MEKEYGGSFRRDGSLLVWTAPHAWSSRMGLCTKVARDDGDRFLVEVIGENRRRVWVPVAKVLSTAEAAAWLRHCEK